METWKEETVPVTLHLTAEAARILHQYAGERSRGKFVSALLVAQRQQDEKEAQRWQVKHADQRNNAASKKKKNAHR